MSHGSSGEGAVSEPNLTPLLDVVLQLLMFFMMCVNFVNEQVNENINPRICVSGSSSNTTTPRSWPNTTTGR
jgi:biopolymer transport protein ExbD